MKTWIDLIKFLNDMGVLPLVLLLIAIPGGFLGSLLVAKRYLLKGVGPVIKSGFDTWLLDQRERTKTEVKLEERISDLTEQLKQLVAGSWDLRRYFDDRLERTDRDHNDILTKLDHVLLLAKKRKSDWMRPPETEMFLQSREKGEPT
jgi:hypothetical protein